MEDTVICMVCGKSFKRITNTHLKMHDMTIDSYKEMFPDANTTSEETRKAIRTASKIRFEDPEEMRKMIESVKRVRGTPESRKKTSIANEKRWSDPEEREKMRVIQIKRYEDPKEREKMSIANKKRYEDINEREKQRKIQLERWSDPEEHEKASERIKKTYEDPLKREKLRDAQIKRFEDPEEREKLRKIQIERWSDLAEREKYSGENASNWQGGISFDKYCPKFNILIKQEVRDKYNNSDFISGLPDYICNKNGYKLDVHHVDYNKQQGCDDHEWKLIPLSRANHIRTNNNRPFWNNLFTYALQYDEECHIAEAADIFSETIGGLN